MCKLFHLVWSYKAMIVLFYSLYSSVTDLAEAIAVDDAKARSYYSDHLCTDGSYAQAWEVCIEQAQDHPALYAMYTLVAGSSLYALAILMYILCKSPTEGTLGYYAFLVMTKREKYFKIFIKVMYAVTALILIIFIGVFFWLISVDASVSNGMIGNIFSTLILSGLSVSELRKTNEINFTYQIPDNENDNDHSKPIYLAKSCCCSCVTAEDLFEKLEEAVLVYSITGDNQLLKLCLKDDSDTECERVMKYYKHIFATQMTEMVGSAEKTKKSIELNTVISSAANTLDVVSSNA